MRDRTDRAERVRHAWHGAWRIDAVVLGLGLCVEHEQRETKFRGRLEGPSREKHKKFLGVGTFSISKQREEPYPLVLLRRHSRARGVSATHAKLPATMSAALLAISAMHARAFGAPRAVRASSPRAIRHVRASSSPARCAAKNAEDAVEDKASHNREQAALRDDMVSGCSECTMPFESERACVLAHAALNDHSRARAIEADVAERRRSDEDVSSRPSRVWKMRLRALVVGAETGKLASELVRGGATDVLVVEHSERMIRRASESFGAPSVSGNEGGVRFFQGDVCEVPAYQGPFDVIVFNDTLSEQHDSADALRRAVLLARPGARVIVAEREKETVSLSFDARARLLDVDALVADLPLQASNDDPRSGKTMGTFGEDPSREVNEDSFLDMSCASKIWTFEVPPLFKLRDAVKLRAPVVEGFGRGSRLMGVPTANLDPDVLREALEKMRRGVYFGYARLPDDARHGRWCKCVVNVGQRPTFADGEGVTVEVHALRDFGRDFYGEIMEVVVLGFVRPEMRFDGFQSLVARIMADIGLARGALDDPLCKERVDGSVGFQEADE
jgi:riboflavin kinase